ncbi:MAG: aldo/keto reductase [Planctomycetota bacterium]|nr:aldo/keto reductase [Planctomycetota bacterium]
MTRSPDTPSWVQVWGSRRLGRTGMRVTPLGLGGAWLGKTASGFSDETAIAAVLRALALGINVVDTAPLYGESERRVGLALREWRARGGKRADLVLSTKTGTRTRSHDYSAAGTRRSVEESLRLLQTDYVDIVFVHDPTNLTPVLAPGGALEELRRLKAEGLVRAIGLGVREHEFHRRCIETGQFEVSLTYRDYNLISQDAVAGILEPAAARDVGVFNGMAVLGGLLGSADPQAAPPAPIQARPYLRVDEEVRRARALWELGRAHGISLLALNLQFCLRERRIASTLVGVQTAAEIEQDVEAVSRPIPEEVWRELHSRFGL